MTKSNKVCDCYMLLFYLKRSSLNGIIKKASQIAGLFYLSPRIGRLAYISYKTTTLAPARRAPFDKGMRSTLTHSDHSHIMDFVDQVNLSLAGITAILFLNNDP